MNQSRIGRFTHDMATRVTVTGYLSASPLRLMFWGPWPCWGVTKAGWTQFSWQHSFNSAINGTVQWKGSLQNHSEAGDEISTISSCLLPRHLRMSPHVTEVHVRVVFWRLGRNDEKLCEVVRRVSFLYLLIPGVLLLYCGQGMSFFLFFYIFNQKPLRSVYWIKHPFLMFILLGGQNIHGW